MVKTKTSNQKKTLKKPTKSTKVAKPAEPVVKQTVNAAETPVVESQVNVSGDKEGSSVNTIFESVIAQSENILNNNKQMLSLMKKTFKSYQRERRDYEKNLARDRRRAKKDPNRKKREPSGFAVATDISNKLCDFLGVNHGTQLSRTDVTRKVTAYIRTKNLQVPENRRSFIPDSKLESILGPLQEVDKDKGFTYFNLQRYITPHITSSASSAQSAQSASSAQSAQSASSS
jgi:chromatin remodeling complex protein RSC6